MKNDNSKQWKIRASKIGLLMGEPKKKTEVLSETAKSFLIELYTGYTEFETSKYTLKGNLTEHKIISMIDVVFNCNGNLTKNSSFYENEFFTGTPDVLYNDIVFDAKSSWSINTLHKHALKGEEEIYKYQLLAYMDLLGYNQGGYVFRGLVNTPPECNKGKEIIWEDIPLNQRHICFKVEYCKYTIDRMKLQVERARDFLADYHKNVASKIGKINIFY